MWEKTMVGAYKSLIMLCADTEQVRQYFCNSVHTSYDFFSDSGAPSWFDFAIYITKWKETMFTNGTAVWHFGHQFILK